MLEKANNEVQEFIELKKYEVSDEWLEILEVCNKKANRLEKEIIKDVRKGYEYNERNVFSEHDKNVMHIVHFEEIISLIKDANGKQLVEFIKTEIANMEKNTAFQVVVPWFGMAIDTPVFSKLDEKRFELIFATEVSKYLDAIMSPPVKTEEVDNLNPYPA